MNYNDEILKLQERCAYLEKERDDAIAEKNSSALHFKEKLARAGQRIGILKATLMSCCGMVAMQNKATNNANEALVKLEKMIRDILEKSGND